MGTGRLWRSANCSPARAREKVNTSGGHRAGRLWLFLWSLQLADEAADPISGPAASHPCRKLGLVPSSTSPCVGDSLPRLPSLSEECLRGPHTMGADAARVIDRPRLMLPDGSSSWTLWAALPLTWCSLIEDEEEEEPADQSLPLTGATAPRCPGGGGTWAGMAMSAAADLVGLHPMLWSVSGRPRRPSTCLEPSEGPRTGGRGGLEAGAGLGGDRGADACVQRHRKFKNIQYAAKPFRTKPFPPCHTHPRTTPPGSQSPAPLTCGTGVSASPTAMTDVSENGESKACICMSFLIAHTSSYSETTTTGSAQAGQPLGNSGKLCMHAWDKLPQPLTPKLKGKILYFSSSKRCIMFSVPRGQSNSTRD